jgi:hypothetical protein
MLPVALQKRPVMDVREEELNRTNADLLNYRRRGRKAGYTFG